MLSFIRGTVADLTENSAIIESNCIGFEINMTGNALAQLHIGQEVKLHTYFQVREDAMVLYGFFNKDDLQVFKLLLGVNGVGPKAALGVLAGITADELRFAVLSDDVKTLSKAPGIGKKTAQKLILELKDKLSLEEAFEQKLANEQAGAAAAAGASLFLRLEMILPAICVTNIRRIRPKKTTAMPRTTIKAAVPMEMRSMAALIRNILSSSSQSASAP